MRSQTSVFLVASAALLLLASPVSANPVGSVFSGPTDGDGASLYWNPAAMSLVAGTNLYLTGNLVLVRASYQRSGTDGQTGGAFPESSFLSAKPEPVLAAITDKVHPRLRIGLAATLPIVLGSGWPEKQRVNGKEILGPTRYYATSSQFVNLFIHLAVSFKINEYLSIGAGPNLVITQLAQDQHADLANEEPLRSMLINMGIQPCSALPCENPLFSANTNIKGLGFSGGGNVGILLTPTPRLRIGIGYHTPVKVNIPATISIDGSKLEALARQYFPGFTTLGLNAKGEISLTIPMQLHGALAFDITPGFELMAGMQWIDMSEASVFAGAITQKGSQLLPDRKDGILVRSDQFTYFARAMYRVRSKFLFSDNWRFGLRAEFLPNTSPSNFASPQDIDFDKIDISAGFDVRIGRGLRLGGTYSHVFAIGRTISASSFRNENPSPFNKPDPSGSYRAIADRIGFTLDYTFY